MFFAENFAEFRRNCRNFMKCNKNFLKFCKFLEILRCKGQAGSKMTSNPSSRLSSQNTAQGTARLHSSGCPLIFGKRGRTAVEENTACCGRKSLMFSREESRALIPGDGGLRRPLAAIPERWRGPRGPGPTAVAGVDLQPETPLTLARQRLPRLPQRD